jgi:hypothetical protein
MGGGSVRESVVERIVMHAKCRPMECTPIVDTVPNENIFARNERREKKNIELFCIIFLFMHFYVRAFFVLDRKRVNPFCLILKFVSFFNERKKDLFPLFS